MPTEPVPGGQNRDFDPLRNESLIDTEAESLTLTRLENAFTVGYVHHIQGQDPPNHGEYLHILSFVEYGQLDPEGIQNGIGYRQKRIATHVDLNHPRFGRDLRLRL
ncbi:hypothetical protein ACIF9R_20670 [Streptomyces sp. NPDC086080]|uniref:hypothetical protein n=1 Tax=Streptomyces sp. NPDC086080 TaxID=3365748 RepID=UPI0037D1D4DE